MTLLNDREIAQLAEAGMIDAFEKQQKSENVISYGLSSFGYDMRVDNVWSVYRNSHSDTGVHDPKLSMLYCVEQFKAKEIVLNPGDFVLCRSYERFVIPDDVMVIVVGKSTYARLGIVVNVTPLEPSWEGHVTIELANTNTVPVRIHAHEGIAQCLFFRGATPETTYAQRKGRYQGQTGITLPFV